MHITLRAGEKLYLNGAVLRMDRKVSLELMNDATFLLESHVMHVDKATTPVRQLYFIVQTMLINPRDTTSARAMYHESMARMLAAYDDADVLAAMAAARTFIDEGRHFEALKVLRGVFGRDDTLMGAPRVDLALAG